MTSKCSQKASSNLILFKRQIGAPSVYILTYAEWGWGGEIGSFFPGFKRKDEEFWGENTFFG